MWKAGSLVVLLALAAAGCEDSKQALVLGPTPPAGTPALPPPVAHPRLADAHLIAIGETVRGQVTGDDPLCDPTWAPRCRYFKLTAPGAATLRVMLRWSAGQLDPYPLDIEVHGPNRSWGGAVAGPGAQRYVDVAVEAGATYLIEVFSFLGPAEPFELTTSIEPR